MSTTYPFKNLALRGGGVKGIAYAGAIQVLADQGILPNIERVAGTSAGSANAMLLALKYTPAEILQILKDTDFSEFEDKKRNARIPISYGLYKGEALFEWTQNLVKKSPLGLSETATFADLKAAGGLDLYAFAVDLNTKTIAEFSNDKTPTVPIAEAIRASMSIPLFFKAWKFSNDNPTDHIYVDGGVMYVYPLSVFDDTRFVPEEEDVNHETLGLHLSNLDDEDKGDDLKYLMPLQYVKNLFESLIIGQDQVLKRNPEDLERTVRINDFGIPGTEFTLPQSDIDRLVQSGKDATTAYLGSYTLPEHLT
jgi:NTE family protein